MSRLTRRLIVGLGDGKLELVVPPGAAVDVGLDWSRVLRGETLVSSTWESLDGAAFTGTQFGSTVTEGVLGALEHGQALRLVNTVRASGGAIVSRLLTVKVRE